MGLRNLAIAIGIAACILGLFLTVGIVSTWLQAATGVLRPLLEVLPESMVARSIDGEGGSPWIVAALNLVVPIGLVIWMSVLARRAIQSSQRLKALGLLVLRAVAAVFFIALSMMLAAIAAGSDLRGNGSEAPDTYIGLSAQVPNGFAGTVIRTDTVWAMVLVLVVVLLLGAFSYWRLSHRINANRARSF
ncbi:hypothetical protein CQ010_04040 [Arthrobacter sp. MYb211]|nr:hypothetical protein CQ015_00035 [Arthrobacter sp. MYb221]PRC09098.1 hypothetical protein CQ010_04040 [Arthrobacter sp. MYb211]